MSETQISGYVSERTKEQLEEYAAAHGIKKGYLLEQALLHHLKALRELPPDIIIPPQIVVTAKSFARVVARIKKPRAPNKALRALLAGKHVAGEPEDW